MKNINKIRNRIIVSLAILMAFTLQTCIPKGSTTQQDQQDEQTETEKPAAPTGLNVGDIAPELELPQADGTPLSLAKLRGKFVLIEFWSAADTAMKSELLVLHELNTSFQMEGLEIYAVCTDDNKAAWEKTLEEGKTNWYNVLDPKTGVGESLKTFNITATPSNYMLSPGGKILAKNIHGEELRKFVRAQFKRD